MRNYAREISTPALAAAISFPLFSAATARAGVLGATGYTGRELLRLLAPHPRLEIAFATSESAPSLSVQGREVELVPLSQTADLEADLVFCCLPSGESGAIATAFAERGVRAVDLSADLRPPTGGSIYGLTELYRESIREAALVANPGCYPTGALLALAPLLRLELVAGDGPVIVDAASGVTGAGRSARPELLFGEVAEDFRAYGTGNVHRHLPEMRWGLEEAGGFEVPLVFTPHLLPVRRGILETVYVPIQPGVTAADVFAAWEAAYRDEPYIELFRDRPPSLTDAVGRNAVCLHACNVSGGGFHMVQLVVALDNLLKGASGQALQNANLMLGFDETLGLPL
jgi:N-acetyl-gamma-glutamyl-phosphate reductase